MSPDIEEFLSEFRKSEQNDMLYQEIEELNRQVASSEPIEKYIKRILEAQHARTS